MFIKTYLILVDNKKIIATLIRNKHVMDYGRPVIFCMPAINKQNYIKKKKYE